MSRSKRAASTRTITVKAHKRELGATKRRAPRAAGEVAPLDPRNYIHQPWKHVAGVNVTQETLLEVSAVYGCVRLIVDSLAPAPITVSEVKAGGMREAKPDDPAAYVLNYGAPVSVSGDAMPAQAIEEALYWQALTSDGNGYAEIQWDRAGRFVALWPIESCRVTPKWITVKDAEGREVPAYGYEIQQPYGGTVWKWPQDMFHLRGPSLFGFLGDSPVYRASKAIGIALAAQAFSGGYFANGAIPSGILSSDKAITKEQADRAKAQWNETHKGSNSAHGLAVLGQGLKYEAVSSNAQESQLIESRRFQVAEIARFFGVPTTLLADNEAWTNLSELYLGFYRSALRPWAERFDAEATRKLFPMRAPWREVAHDLTHLTLGSFKDQVAACAQAVAGGLWTRNEARAVFGKNDTPGGDVMVVASGTVRLADALKPAAKPAPAAPAPAKPDMETEEDDTEGEDGEEMPSMPVPTRRAADVARVAVALDRFQRAMAARRKAMEKDAPEKTESNLAELRARLEPGVIAECSAVLTEGAELEMRIKAAADAVLAGEPPHLAAERLCT